MIRKLEEYLIRVNFMNTLQNTKKQQILKVLDKVEEQIKKLKHVLEDVYTFRSLKAEKEFVNSCNYLQMLTKQALSETGYYKSLCGVPRRAYAPEELEGDEYDLSNLISIEMNRLEKQIEEGNKACPINELDTTKEQWLESIEIAKTRYKEIYNETKEFYEEEDKSEWNTKPVETNIIMEDDIINMAKGFMAGPVGLFRNKAVEAITQKFDNLAEMQIFLYVQSKTKDMVLYMTYEQCGNYFFRGAFVDKQ